MLRSFLSRSKCKLEKRLSKETTADTSTSSTGNGYKTTTGSRDYLPEEPSLTQPNHSFQCYIEAKKVALAT